MSGRGLGFGGAGDDYGNDYDDSDGSVANGSGSSGDEQQMRQGLGQGSKIRTANAGRVSFVTAGEKRPSREEEHDGSPQERIFGHSSMPSRGALPPEAAKWQKHTSGFAAKYLSKFGFKGRLGKNEQGMSQPVAVKARPDKLGLGAGGFKEATHLKQNRELVRELRSTDPNAPQRSADDEFSSSDSALDSDEEMMLAGGGRVASRKRPRRVYRTAAEMLAGAQDGTAPAAAAAPTIVDMTQGTARVVSSVSDLFTDSGVGGRRSRRRERSHDPLASGPAGLGQELLFNMKTLLSAAEADVKGAHAKLQGTKRRLATVRSDTRLLQEAAEQAQGHTRQLKAAQNAWESLVHAVQLVQSQPHAHKWTAARSAVNSLRALFVTHTAVAMRLQLPEVVPSVISSLVESALHDEWTVTEHAHVDALLDFLRACSQCVEELSMRLHAADAQAGEGGSDSDEGVDHSTQLYSECASASSAAVLHRLRLNMHSGTWDPRTQSPPVVHFLRGVLDSSRGEEGHTLLATPPIERWLQLDVVPVLHRALEDWQPSTDPVPLFEWLSMWKGVPEAYVQLEGGLTTAVAKVQEALQDWEATDASAEPMVRRLASLLPPAPLQRALARCVTPKLEALLKEEASALQHSGHWWKVTPAVHLVFKWAEVLPHAEMVALLCSEYLPAWVAAANAAFQQQTPPRDTTQHLTTFMDSLPDVVAQSTVVQKFVLLLLRVASIAASKALDLQVQAALPSLPPPRSMLEVRARLLANEGGSLKEPVPDSRPAAAPPAPSGGGTHRASGAPWGTEAPELTLQEATAHAAAARGLSFVPARLGKKINGQQVFVLGKRNVFFAKGLVWAEDAESGQYRPHAVEDLLSSM